jgi:hypothetical protein
VAAVLFAVSPLVSGGFGGFDPGRFPVPQVDVPVQPAGWAFSIWGLIYLWLIAHAGFGLLRRAADPDWDRTRLPMIVALGLGAAWIPVAKGSPAMATGIIALMLAAAVLAFLRAPRRDRFWAAAPIGLFAGWLTAATGVSTGLVLGGWGLAGEVTAAVVALLWTLGLAAALTVYRGEPAYAAGVAWALVGIVAANGMAVPAVSALALAGIAALTVLSLRPSSGAQP